MKAVVQRAHGGPEVLTVEQVAAPVPLAGEVAVAVRAAALNRLDLAQLRGPVLPGFSLPHIGGLDLAGDVVAVGPGVDTALVGTRVVVDPQVAGADWPIVLGGNAPGGFAELCAVPAQNAHPIPAAVSHQEAAALPTAYATAWRSLFGVGELAAGQWLLIHGAGSALSLAALQLAVRAGAHVVVSGRGDGRLAVARRLGAAAVVDADSTDVAAAVRAATGGHGADVALDHVGAATFTASLHSLAPGGRLVCVGNTSGDSARIPSLAYLFHRGLQILGAGAYSRQDFVAALSACWSLGCAAVIDQVGRFEDVGRFHRRLLAGPVAGKLVVTP